MSRTIFIFIIAIVIIEITACTILKYKALNGLDPVLFLVDSWVKSGPDGKLYEKWTKQNENVLVGKSYKLVRKDTLLLENLKIYIKNNEIWYSSIMNSDSTEVQFQLISTKDNKLIFKNPKIDFPNTIIYTKMNDYEVKTELIGTQAKAKKSIEFSLQRMEKQ